MAVMLLKLLFFLLISHVFFFLDQERINSTDSFFSSSPSKLIIPTSILNGTIRHPIKPQTMAQAPIPTEEPSLLDVSSDGDITIMQKRKILAIYDVKFC